MSDYTQLCRPGISLFAALSAGCSYILAGPQDMAVLSALSCGVFILASGASCLNQYQEHGTDALMTRTKSRPLPSGRIVPSHALYFGASAIIAGLAILVASGGLNTSAIGLFAVIWYNGIYTYLKRKTALAAVPGALTGALIPAIGWAAGSGSLTDPRLLALSLFFGLWQVPHFWLLVVDHGCEYVEAGLPSLTQILGPAQIKRLIFAWIAATAMCGLVLCLFDMVATFAARYLILAVSVWLVWQGVGFIARKGKESRLMFVKINIYMLAVMGLLCCDRLYMRSIDIISRGMG